MKVAGQESFSNLCKRFLALSIIDESSLYFMKFNTNDLKNKLHCNFIHLKKYNISYRRYEPLWLCGYEIKIMKIHTSITVKIEFNSCSLFTFVNVTKYL